MVKFLIHFLFLLAGLAYVARRGERFFWRDARLVRRGDGRQRGLRRAPAARGARRDEPRRDLPPAADRRRERDQRLRRRQRVERLPAERAHGRPEPPRDHARHPAPRPAADLPAARARAPLEELARGAARLPAPRRAGDALAQRAARARARAARARGAVPALRRLARSCWCRSASGSRSLVAFVVRSRLHYFEVVLRSRDPDRRQVDLRALRRLRLHPAGAAPAPAVRARAEQLLRLLRVRHRQDELGAALVLRRADRGDRASSGRRCSPPSSGASSGGSRAARRDRARARGGARPARGAGAAARVGADRRARRDDGRERLLPDDAVLLLLRVRGALPGGADRVRAPLAA